MTLLVQEFLKTKSFEQLYEEHGIEHSFSKCGTKFSLNYSQIAAKDSDIMAQQCRGLILSASDYRNLKSEMIMKNNRMSSGHIIPGETVIQAYPMKRFFNIYTPEAKIGSSFVVQEKLDGSCIIVYFDKNKQVWFTATRSTPEADIPTPCGKTFRELFEHALKTYNMSFQDFTSLLSQDHCYVFELTGPFNRIVVDYPISEITLLAVRNLNTLNEISIDSIDLKTIPKINQYDFSNIEQIVEFVNSRNPLNHEGCVLLDKDFNRVKIKSVSYCDFNKLNHNLGVSDRSCLQLILNEKEDDVLAYLPNEIKDKIILFKNKFVNFLSLYQTHYDSIDEVNQKEFALKVQSKNLICGNFFFTMRKNNLSFKDFIKSCAKDGEYPVSILDKIADGLSKEV